MHRLKPTVSSRTLQSLNTDLYDTTGFIELANDALDPVVVPNHHGYPVTQLGLDTKAGWEGLSTEIRET